MIFLFKKDFKKRFRKLPKPVQEKFSDRLKFFEKHPFHPTLNNHPLHGDFIGCRSINITGDYRAVFEILDEETIEFVTIGTHSELYS
jgi:addiction module RelE/StbE family toxin